MAIKKGEAYNSSSINNNIAGEPSMIIITGNNLSQNSQALNDTISSYCGVSSKNSSKYSQGSRSAYRSVDTNISVRDQYSRPDYDYFRSSEQIPTQAKEILSQCMEAYRRVGLVRNVIDLMSDFGAQGIRIVHPNKRQQRFYRSWFKKVRGIERTERALNYLYRCGIFISKRHMAKLPYDEQRQMNSTYAIDGILQPDIENDSKLRTSKNNIPIRYVFLNPLTLEITSEELGTFIGKQTYAIKVSNKLLRLIKKPSDIISKMMNSLPKDLLTALRNGQRIIPLDPDKISVRYYKRDDWAPWADPMIYAILDDLRDLEKMKMADRAALDSVISQVRLWKLGDLEKGIFPTAVAVNRLIEILLSNPGGGAFDIVWGPELSFEETSTDVHEFLGDDKYIPVMNRIYAGLGVPPTLTGAATASGFTNNYISLQTLIKRLEYGRQVVASFWDEEIELVRQAMNFQRGARVEFDYQILTDEASVKALLIQLADRDIISVDTLAERFNEDPEIEQLKIRREMRSRKTGLMNDKAGPWHAPEKIHEYIRSAVGRGFLGLDLPDKEYPYIIDTDTPWQQQMDAKIGGQSGNYSQDKKKKKKGGRGRPVGSRDSYPRRRNAQPLGASEQFLSVCMWAKEALNRISNIVTPGVLYSFGKKNQRQLSGDEVKYLENFKFGLLSYKEPFTDVVEDDILLAVDNGQFNVDDKIIKVYNNLIKGIVEKRQEEPNIEELRMLQIYAYALCNC